MGLSADLGYEIRAQGALHRQVVRLASTKPASALMRKVLPSVDRVVLRATTGRTTLSSLLSGLPVVWVTTTGARSGQPRTVPLLAFPAGNDLALLGTSFGQAKTPGWVHNIESDPNVTISYRGASVRGRARPAREAEEPGIWERAGAVYPGYSSYGERAAHRRIRVFVLESSPIG
ncbi:MAG TPA: nitroreductase family deazaflavin-dependent oxidoreductase [Acidimicrobiia bacterium]|nr:nitroreductase family deazaflavin-dependent oxidoreductase [Acidimicrobiia bacterium]